MIYIEPNTVIKLYHGVPLDNSYKNTLYFANISSQNTYFHSTPSIVKTVLYQQTYARVNRGVLRVEGKADLYYDCNYMSFQNSSYGNKWFYAFINSVEYVNDNATNIVFEIDVMQTYWFDINIAECFIERQHSLTDDISECLVPENIETGEYTCWDTHFLSFGDLYVQVIATYSWEDTTSDLIKIVEGSYDDAQYIYNMLGYQHFLPTVKSDLDKLKRYLKALNNTEGTHMVSLDMIPGVCSHHNNPAYDDSITFAERTKFADFTPNNKKLFTNPYSYILADDSKGHVQSYKYELFSNLPKFKMTGNNVPIAIIWTYPKNYKGLTENLNEAIETKDFPSCPTSTNTFEEWYARYKNVIGTNMALDFTRDFIGGAINIAMGATSQDKNGNWDGQNQVIGGATQVYNSVADVLKTVAEIESHKIGSQQCVSRGNGANIAPTMGKNGITFYEMGITKPMAQKIDSFFDMYGYAYHQVGKPNINSRKHWNYVKTLGSVILPKLSSGCPSDDLKTISYIFDNGITFWKNPSEVGKYSELASDNKA